MTVTYEHRDLISSSLLPSGTRMEQPDSPKAQCLPPQLSPVWRHEQKPKLPKHSKTKEHRQHICDMSCQMDQTEGKKAIFLWPSHVR